MIYETLFSKITSVAAATLARNQRGGVALITLIAFMVLAVPLVMAANGVSNQLVRSSMVYDGRLTGAYGAASGLEVGLSEIQDFGPAISELEDGESATFQAEVNGAIVIVTVTKLPQHILPGNPYADVVITMDSFGDLAVDPDDLVAAIKKTSNSLVDKFELEFAGSRIRIGVTRFKNATNNSDCGNSQSVVYMTDVDYHGLDGDGVGENHSLSHSDTLTPHEDDPENEPIHEGIDSLSLQGNDLTSGTNLVKGIKCGVEQYKTGLGERDFAPNVLIFMTDGKDTLGNGPADFQAQVAELVNKDLSSERLDEVFAIGIGVAYEGGYPNIDSCADDYDNDQDGKVDKDDPDCVGHEDGFTFAGVCTDGLDNGGDGLADDDDPDCQMDLSEGGFPDIPGSCGDGYDNDNDGYVDGADHDCSLNLNAIAYDPDAPEFNLNGAEVIVPAGNPYAWDHVLHSDDFDEILDRIQEIVDAVLLAGGIGYEVVSVAPDGSTVISLVILTDEGEIVVVSWEAFHGEQPSVLATPTPPPATPPPAAAPTVSSLSEASGTTAGGTAVTIFGTGFASGADVTFGGIPATNVNFVSANALTAETPAHALGFVDVEVTNPDSQNGELTSAYEYIVPVEVVTITKAAYNGNKNPPQLAVEATSSFGGSTSLQVTALDGVNLVPAAQMDYNANQNKWTVTVAPVNAKPGEVTVCSTAGASPACDTETSIKGK